MFYSCLTSVNDRTPPPYGREIRKEKVLGSPKERGVCLVALANFRSKGDNPAPP